MLMQSKKRYVLGGLTALYKEWMKRNMHKSLLLEETTASGPR